MANGAIASQYEDRPLLAGGGSVRGPSRLLLPGKIFFDTLRLGLIAPPVPLIEFQNTQTLQVLLKSLTNGRGPIHLLSLGRNVCGFPELRVENDLYDFQCGVLSKAY